MRTERIILPVNLTNPNDPPSGCPFQPTCFVKVGKIYEEMYPLFFQVNGKGLHINGQVLGKSQDEYP